MTLAYGVLAGGGVCARVGERVVDLSALGRSLNEFMAGGPAAWEQARARIDEGVEVETPELGMPFEVADYVDFYSSLHHATNAGRMFRPGGDPLPPNWRHVPVSYTHLTLPTTPYV